MDRYTRAHVILSMKTHFGEQKRERKRKSNIELAYTYIFNKYETKRDCAEPDTISCKRNYLRSHPVQITVTLVTWFFLDYVVGLSVP